MPAYAFGYVSGAKDDASAVFWCANDIDGYRQYHLVFAFVAPKLDTDGCPNVIKGRRFPGDLTIYEREASSVSGFENVTNPDKRRPRHGGFKGTVVESDVEDRREIYYCVDGNWLVETIEPNGH